MRKRSERKKKKKEEMVIDPGFHHLSFEKDEEERLIVYLDGVRVEKGETDLAIKIFENGIWFKFERLPDPVDFE